LNSHKLLAGILVFVLFVGLGTPVFAGVQLQPQPGAMYIVTGDQDNDNLDDGALALVDYPGTGDVTQIGSEIADLVDRRSLPGMAFDSTGRLFVAAQGSTPQSQGVGDPILLEIDPATAEIISNKGVVTDENTGTAMRVRDLAMQNNVLYAVGEDGNGLNAFFTINTNTAIASPINTDLELNGLAITPDGTFYVTERFGQGDLYTLNPNNGVTTFVADLETIMDGLGANSQGQLFGTETGPDSVHLIDISDGTDVTVGAVGENPSDVDFFPVQKDVVGGEFLQIETTSLLLTGTQSFSWMIPLVLSGIGIGLLVVSSKFKNS
jgi:sugar lactone lactonase YvrE